MKILNVELVVFCLFGFGTAIQAQNSITVSGGNATGSEGTASYTIGQVFYSINTETNGSVVQGVQQPFEISVLTEIADDKGISFEIEVYPNPASDLLRLKIKNYEVSNLRYQLYDSNGKLIRNIKVESNETKISMQNLVPSVYFIKVTDINTVIKSFKIIKY